MIVCNDPYSGNTHVGDVVTACPVFYKGRHLFWSVTKGHQLDIGSYIPTSVPATAKDVWQEGLTMPPIKFYERGKPREDVIRLYLANVRYRDWLYGDLMAQLGSIWTGRKRLLEVVEQYGPDETMLYVDSPGAQQLVVKADGLAPQRMGEAVRVVISPRTCHLFDPSGGKAIMNGSLI